MAGTKKLFRLLVFAALAVTSVVGARAETDVASETSADSTAVVVSPEVIVRADTTTAVDSAGATVTTVTTVTTMTRVATFISAPPPPPPPPVIEVPEPIAVAPAAPIDSAVVLVAAAAVSTPEASTIMPASIGGLSAGHALASGAVDPSIALFSNGADPAMILTLQHVLEEMGARVVLVPFVPGQAVAPVTVAPVVAPVASSPATSAAVAAPPPIVWEGQLRYRYENRTLFDYRLPGTFGRANTQTLAERGDVSLMRTRFGANLRLAPGVRGFFSLQDARNMGAEGSPSGTLANVDLFNAYVDIDSIGRAPLNLRVGRQVISYGEGRVVAGADWGNAGRGYDGARLRWTPAKLQLDGFVTWINEGRLNGQDRMLSGIDGMWRFNKNAEAEAYFFRRSFGDAGWTSETGRKGALMDGTGGLRARVLHAPFELRVEGAAQRGQRASDNVKSWFAVGRLTTELHNAWKTRLFAEYLQASGDEDPTDGQFQRFDPVYWGGHGFQGALDIVGASNLNDVCGGLNAQPKKGWTLQSEYHVFTLASARDVWVDDAGTTLRRNAAGTAGTNLGRELDATVRWDTRSKVSVLAGASRFWRGDFVRSTGGGSDVNWGFLQLAVSF